MDDTTMTLCVMAAVFGILMALTATRLPYHVHVLYFAMLAIIGLTVAIAGPGLGDNGPVVVLALFAALGIVLAGAVRGARRTQP